MTLKPSRKEPNFPVLLGSVAALAVVIVARGFVPSFHAPADVKTVGAGTQAHTKSKGRPAASSSLKLPRFKRSLQRLATNTNSQPVRILWLGDSHTALEAWTHQVRRSLQEEYGFGGSGFLLMGQRQYAHGTARQERVGSWRPLPVSPAAIAPKQVKHLGLLGKGSIALEPLATTSVELNVGEPWVRERLIWQLLFRLPHPESSFTVTMGSDVKAHQVDRATSFQRESGLASYTLESHGEPQLRLGNFSGKPEIFGVLVDSAKPGVVLDTLGIPGARIETPLSWTAQPWLSEVKARSPKLVVLAYGTNEPEESVELIQYHEAYRALLERLRSVVPEVECLLVGPPDRVDENWESEVRVEKIDGAQRQIAKVLDCEYFSALEEMGGPGSYQKWSKMIPPLAGADRVHLTKLGYQKLGKQLVKRLQSSSRTANSGDTHVE